MFSIYNKLLECF